MFMLNAVCMAVFEQVVQDAVRIGVALDLDVDAHAVAVRLVAQVGDALDLLGPDQLRDLLEEGGFVHHVRQFGDDDCHAVAARLLERYLGPDDDPAAAVGVHLADGVDSLVLAGDRVAAGLVAIHRAAGREVRAEHVLAQVVRRQVRVVDKRPGRVHDFAEVVGRDVRGHAHGDSGRAVHQEVRQPGRQNRRLLLGAVVVVDEVDGVLVDVGQHFGRDAGQASFGVAHCRGAVAVDGAEVALPVDERVAHREVLGQADEGVVERGVAMGVVLAHDLADDRGAFAERGRGRKPHLAHGVEDAAMDGLQAVAHVRQRARHDYAHRVVEVARLHFVFNADNSDPAQIVGHCALFLPEAQTGPWCGAGCGECGG
jgi:hypothetical protein